MQRRSPAARRFWLASLVTLGILPGAGCSSASLSAKAFAERFIHAQIDKEKALTSTCEALSKAQPPASALGRDLQEARLRNAKVLEKAICGEATKSGIPCAYDPLTLTFSIYEPAKLDASAQAVLELIARSSNVEKDLLDEAKTLLSKAEAVEKILAQTTMARVGLFVALKLGDGAQGIVDQTANSFGILQGFARPVLERVASEMVAAAMDKTFAIVEQTYKVPRTNLTQEACTVYEKREPRSSVAMHVLERAILRYVRLDEHKELFRDIYEVDCNDLAQWIKPSGPLEKNVCNQILSNVAPEEAPQDGAVQALLLPKAPPPPVDSIQREVLADDVLEKAAHALSWSASACKQQFHGDRASACTLARVMPVASMVYSDSIITGKTEEPSIHFEDFEQRITALEQALTTLRKDEVEQDKRLEAEKKAAAEKQAALEAKLMEQTQLVETILKQDAALRELTKGMNELAVRAFEEKCRARYDQTLAARETLAKALGFDKLCASAQSEAWIVSTNGLLSVQPSTFCRPELPITLQFSHRFKGCEYQVDCTKDDSKSLCLALSLIAQAVGPNAVQSTETERRPFRFVGFSSILPTGETCGPKLVNAPAYFIDKLEILSTTPKDETAMKLSALRADAASRILLEKLPSLPKQLVELLAAGTANVTEIGNFAVPSKEAETQEAFQRVSLQLHLSQYTFPLRACLGR